MADANAGTIDLVVVPNFRVFSALLLRGIGGSLHSVGDLFKTAFNNIGIISGVAITAGVAASLKSAVAYEDAFKKIDAATNASTQQIGEWKKEVLSISGETAQAPIDVANALYFAASAGLKVSQVMPVVEASAKAAAIGFGDAADTSQILIQALNAYRGTGLSVTKVMDSLTEAIRVGTAEPADYAASLGKVLPIASQVCVSFDELVASIAAMSNVGLSTSVGTTALRQLLVNVAAPTATAADEMNALGISTQKLRDTLATGGVLAALKLLKDASGGNLDVLRKLIPNVRALTGALNLSGNQLAQNQRIFYEVTHATGTFSDAWTTTTRNISFQLKQLGNYFKVAAIAAGESLLPILRNMVSLFKYLLPVIEIVSGHAAQLLIAFLGFKILTWLPRLLLAVSVGLERVGAAATAGRIEGLTYDLDAAGVSFVSLLKYINGAVAALAEGTASMAANAAAAHLDALAQLEMAAATGNATAAEALAATTTGAYSLAMETLAAATTAAASVVSFFGGVIGTVAVGFAAFRGFQDIKNAITTTKDDVYALGSSFKTLGGTMTVPAKALDALKESSTGFVEEVGLLVSGHGPYDQFQTKTKTLVAALKLAAAQGYTTADMTKYLSTHSQQVADVLKQYPTDAHAAAGALVDLFNAANSGIDTMQKQVKTGEVTVKNFIPLFSQVPQQLALLGTDAKTAAQQAVDAWAGGPDKFRKFSEGMVANFQKAWQSLHDTVTQGIDFLGGAFSDLSQKANASAKDYLNAIQKAGKSTEQFGKNLLDITRHGGAALAQMLISMGPDGAKAAATIAGASDKMRDHIINAFNKVQGKTNDVATQITNAIGGTLKDIETILYDMATQKWGLNIDLNDQVTPKLQRIKDELKTSTDSPYFIDYYLRVHGNPGDPGLGGSGGGGGGGGGGTGGKHRAVGGSVRPGLVYRVGEHGPEMFVPGVSGQIVAHDNLRPAGGSSIDGATVEITDSNLDLVMTGVLRDRDRGAQRADRMRRG